MATRVAPKTFHQIRFFGSIVAFSVGYFFGVRERNAANDAWLAADKKCWADNALLEALRNPPPPKAPQAKIDAAVDPLGALAQDIGKTLEGAAH